MSHLETTSPSTAGPHPPGYEIAAGYRLIDHMRRGGDCDTYDAWSDERYTRVFIKTVRPDCGAQDDYACRLVQHEGRLLLSFTHPHIARAYELVDSHDGSPVLIMETLSGPNVRGMLAKTQRPLGIESVVHLGKQLCSALRYIHDRGYLHLDVKPSNIIAHGGHARLIDFALSRPPGPCTERHGTRFAMAPEQVRVGMLGAATDVWGTGLVLYEAATGVHPFLREDAATSFEETSLEEYYPQIAGPAAPVRSWRELPPAMAAAIDACLEPESERRPTLAELDEVLSAEAERSQQATRAPGSGQGTRA
ncbi:hypothetical protein GCM10025787_46650 [Saccharopolyspora rosea]|uniref:non-specific serine/threonine protein kinase n=1 Tax=Saccharopolyspora rosea TaxID=524884 RepID=A0ABW3FVJ2_9PSEU